MATLILQSAGAALGAFFGGPVGAMLGRTLGGLAGSTIDRQLFGTTLMRDGARLTDMPGLSSSDGAPIPRLYGRARLGGQLIWATRFLETSETQQSGGKGLGGAPTIKTRTFLYHANFAIGLCEGPIAYVRQIWADGKLLDWADLTLRIYRGDEDQEPDPLIIAKEGQGNAPAYRGLAYIVFENFLLSDYGNRIPQFSFEIVKPVDGIAQSIRAINLIPGAGEFVYDPRQVTSETSDGGTEHLTRHQLVAANDFEASLDQLVALCPNLETVQLVITWFGDDLRASHCTLMPRVESRTTIIEETEWICAGHMRETIPLVSQHDGRAAYGGTPSDGSVIRAVRALKARGLKVVIYPFIMMDIAPDNQRSDPWTGTPQQPPYPWRGRITTERATGRVDSTDLTAQVDHDIAAFFGSLPISALHRQGDTVFADREEWSLRRLVFHYAVLLGKEEIDGFIIGSELCGLTRLRNASGAFPAVGKLIAIADDVRKILSPQIGVIYAADWSEYGSYVTASGDVYFPLDPLFAHEAITTIGIDAYWPLSDWRDGPLHEDRKIATTLYDPAYLVSRFGAGEDFDWYYAKEDAGFASPTYSSIGVNWHDIPASQCAAALNDADCFNEVWGGYAAAIVADLGSCRSISKIAIAPISSELNWGGAFAADLDITMSDDALDWTYIGRTPAIVAEGRLTEIEINRPARFIKLQPTFVRAGGVDFWIGLSEFRVVVRSDRQAQVRTPITDGAYREPWIYRSKDLVNWWSHAHYERIGGIRSATPTAWRPQSKPITLIEFGCPAVDRGSNAPNIFPDPKSVENRLPPYSRGSRDDLIQYRTIEALYSRFDPTSKGFDPTYNPVSNVNGLRMLDIASSALWAWDARPFPAFPDRVDIWSDGAHYQTGHWLNGRLEGVSLDRLISAILKDFDLPDAEIAVHQFFEGYVIDQPMSARAALEPLASLLGLECVPTANSFRFLERSSGDPVALDDRALVPVSENGLVQMVRSQENELPQELRLSFSDADHFYRSSTVTSRRLSSGAKGCFDRAAPIIIRQSAAQRIADLALYDLWSRRTQLKLRVRPGCMALEAGDLITLDAIGHSGTFRIERIIDAADRMIEAQSIDPDLADIAMPNIPLLASRSKPAFAGVPKIRAITLPPLTSSPMTVLALAASATPWNGPLAIWRSIEGASYSLVGSIERPSLIGHLLAPFADGPIWRFDMANFLEIELPGAMLVSQSEVDALAAKSVLAIQGEDEAWEIISYQNAEVIGANRYRLSRLLRGLGGTEHLAQRSVSVGRPVIVLDNTITALATGADHIGETWALRIVPSGREVSDPNGREIITTVEGLALRPLAPVHAEARRVETGIRISWIRRARENADTWGLVDLALDEQDERYEVEILDRGHVIRVLNTFVPYVVYDTAFERQDFDRTLTTIALRLYQLSRAVGRGAVCAVDLIIR